MQRQILPAQIQALQNQIESRILVDQSCFNNYFEPFKLKKVTLELDEQQLFAYDPEFSNYVKEEQEQKAKLDRK